MRLYKYQTFKSTEDLESWQNENTGLNVMSITPFISSLETTTGKDETYNSGTHVSVAVVYFIEQ